MTARLLQDETQTHDSKGLSRPGIVPLVVWLERVSDFWQEGEAACATCVNRMPTYGFCAILHGPRVKCSPCPGVSVSPPPGFEGYPRAALDVVE